MEYRLLAGLLAIGLVVMARPAAAAPPDCPPPLQAAPWQADGPFPNDGEQTDKARRRALRELRLREAIRNGDLTEEQAEHLRKHPRAWMRMREGPPAPPDEADGPPGQKKRCYWRNKQRQSPFNPAD